MKISIGQYYNEYISNTPKSELPGEHHFVSIYLVTKIYDTVKILPIYVNPDGMKKINGDLVYKELDRQISIEVKYMNINFTKTQNNEWIIDCDKTGPDYFIAVGMKNVIITKWTNLVAIYKNAIYNRNANYIFKEMDSGYTPSISVDELALNMKENIDYVNITSETAEDQISDLILGIFNKGCKL